jgi:predicted GIY-YIG superfamily endonuclease
MNVAPSLREVVLRNFFATHSGRSTDDVVIDDIRNAAFIAACQEEVPTATPYQLNWELYNLRKQPPGIGRVTTVKTRDRHDDYLHASEIAARHMEDEHQRTIDQVLCDPDMRRQFDALAQSIAPGVTVYLLRKAALKLRKGRQLKPELIKRVADWGRVVSTHTAEELLADFDLIPRQPGVYIFRDRTGFLYIGECGNLRARVAQHMDHSDRKALAHYLWQNGFKELTIELHAFRKDSDGKIASHRKAYETDLIRSRKPRLNIKWLGE